jgi:hypothetical protein
MLNIVTLATSASVPFVYAVIITNGKRMSINRHGTPCVMAFASSSPKVSLITLLLDIISSFFSKHL